MTPAAPSSHYQVLVIGGGSAGYAAARTAAAAGLRTAIVDGAAVLGGLCILRGCMPTKALLHVSDILHHINTAAELGIHTQPPLIDFPKVMARKDRLIQEFAEYRQNQLAHGKFQLYRATARFTSNHTVELSDGQVLTSDHFVIATGSQVSPPPLPALSQVGFLTSDDALVRTHLPRSLIVLGGGAVAVELAQFYQRLGTQVSLIQRSAQLLRDFDADAAQVVAEALRADGMQVFTQTKLLEAGQHAGLRTVTFEQDGQPCTATGEEILLALGRSPNTSKLALDVAEVDTKNGRILTNSTQQTSAPHIYAAGDCTGPHEIVHIAIQQAEIAVHNILHPTQPRHMDYRLLTSVVFTDPQLATVGHTEKSAQAANLPFLSASYPFNDHGKSIIMQATRGFVKLLADPATGSILGGACVGPAAGELIHEIIVAMAGRLTVHELAATPHYHPTLAEIWTYPAEDLAAQIPR